MEQLELEFGAEFAEDAALDAKLDALLAGDRVARAQWSIARVRPLSRKTKAWRRRRARLQHAASSRGHKVGGLRSFEGMGRVQLAGDANNEATRLLGYSLMRVVGADGVAMERVRSGYLWNKPYDRCWSIMRNWQEEDAKAIANA